MPTIETPFLVFWREFNHELLARGSQDANQGVARYWWERHYSPDTAAKLECDEQHKRSVFTITLKDLTTGQKARSMVTRQETEADAGPTLKRLWTQPIRR